MIDHVGTFMGEVSGAFAGFYVAFTLHDTYGWGLEALMGIVLAIAFLMMLVRSLVDVMTDEDEIEDE